MPIGAWVAGLVVLSLLVGWLTRRNRPWRAGGVALIGGLLVLATVTILHVMDAVSARHAPRDGAYLWYVAAVMPFDIDLGGQENLGLYYVRDVSEFLPILLTAVVAFVLTCVQRAARAQAPAAQLALTEA